MSEEEDEEEEEKSLSVVSSFDKKDFSENKEDGASSDGWTIQTSKPRRLAPQWTLSRQDLGADSVKSRAAVQETISSLKTRGSFLAVFNLIFIHS